MSNIKETIRKLVDDGRQAAIHICVVDSVDKDARTIDCTPLDESAPILGVNLQANQGSGFGVVAFPRVESFVAVGLLADGNAGVVLLTDDIESVEIQIDDDKSSVVIDGDGIRAKVGDMSIDISSDGITMNGGDLHGLVTRDGVKTQLNAIEKDINDLKAAFAGWTVVPEDGGAALKGAAASWAAQSLSLTADSDIENEKVKQ